MKKLIRVLAFPMLCLAMLMPQPAGAQADYPNRAIRIVLPYPAGGIVDILTRIVAEKLSKNWGQPIVIEPKPGANGNIAWDQVSRAEPDGYTWTFLSPATSANPRMQPSVRWSEKSFIPVGGAVWAPSVVVVRPDLPVSTMKELVDYVRKNPGKLNWVNPGTGTSQHLNTAIMLHATKLEMTGVPYRGQPPGIIDLVSGRVDMMVASIGLVAEHIRTGALKPLAVLGTTRSRSLPDTPTMAEAGYPEVNVVAWYGYSVPRGTPQPVVEKIVEGFNVALKDPGVREALEKQSLQVMDPVSASGLEAMLAADAEKYGAIIKAADIRLDK
ncbi:MAG: Bug family tripartite tricarboxylate transporter substrate binding protein [Bradyrhizobium sp.]|uniref:Bug family tripartite tricarboxylate transporter substrate binding protein n=1 Tax=Bradyrhizobium sp. TaxID=376 RepID=UPI003D117F1B